MHIYVYVVYLVYMYFELNHIYTLLVLYLGKYIYCIKEYYRKLMFQYKLLLNQGPTFTIF